MPKKLLTAVDRKLPLALKVGVPVLVISILASTLLGAFAFGETRSRIDQTYLAQARAFSRMIREQFRATGGNLQAVNAYLRDFTRSHPNLLRVRIHRHAADGTAIVWASSEPTEVGLRVDQTFVSNAEPVQTETTLAGQPVFLTLEPAGDLGDGIRSIAYFFTPEIRAAAIATVRRRVALAAFVVAGLELIALAVAMYFAVLRRAQRLGRAASAVASGNWAIRLPEGDEPPGRDELVNAAREFDHMLRSIHRAILREREDAEALRELDRAKSTLLHAVSHDLRGPITAVIGSAATLRDLKSASEEDRSAMLDGILASARKMQRLVEDLLDLDRLDRGIVEPDRRRVDLAPIVKKVADEWSATSGRTPHLDLASVHVAVDPAKVERIVDNLLANAGRHTPPGTDIWVRTQPFDGGVLLSVEDAGPGVPDAHKDTIFLPFHQGASAADAGAGIGLSLVARFAELHGGRAWVEDREGGGAAFRVFIPDAPPQATEGAPDARC